MDAYHGEQTRAVSPGKETTMTEDKARKIAARQRMAETGEPYSVARHAVEEEHATPAGPPEGVAGDTGAAEVLTPDHTGQARRLAEQARIQAERAAEAADGAEEVADLAQEAAELTQEWGGDEEVDQALRRADEARTAAEQARSRAEQAERLAEAAEDAADLAEGVDDEAWNLADDPEDNPPRWHHHQSRPASPPRPPQPPQPPRPPRPPRGRYQGERPQPGPDPADRLQDRVDQFIHRLSAARDQADRLIGAAERIFTPARSEPARSEPARSEPTGSEPASPE
jgi:hypothetical protein